MHSLLFEVTCLRKKRGCAFIHVSDFNEQHWCFWRTLASCSWGFVWHFLMVSLLLSTLGSDITQAAFALSTLYLHGVDLCGCYWDHTAHLVGLVLKTSKQRSVNTVFIIYAVMCRDNWEPGTCGGQKKASGHLEVDGWESCYTGGHLTQLRRLQWSGQTVCGW